MSARRSSFQIAVEILTVINNGEERLTRIMYASNLSWNSLRGTLDTLVRNGYIDETYLNQKQKRYSTTAKGQDVLKYYTRLESLVQVTAE